MAIFFWTLHVISGQSPRVNDTTMPVDTLRLWATYYYIPQMNHDPAGADLLDKNNTPTGLKLTKENWCKAAIEGTVMIRKDGKSHLLNYHSRSKELQVDCRPYIQSKNFNGHNKAGRVLWSKSTGYGKGTENYQLYPFKSIAVDRSVIPIGSVIFIPAAEGIEYLTVTGKLVKHDGYFFAVDVGSAILGNHIDVFLGITTQSPFPFITSTPDGTFDAYIVDDNEKALELAKLHGK